MPNHILIADDDNDVISALTYLLKTEGFETSAVSSPADALAAIRQNAYQLLLMDLNYTRDTTSGQEGLALLDQVAALDEQLPVIVMTAWGSVETAVLAMQKGARDFIQKPWENERLLSIINNQLLLRRAEQRSRRLSAEVDLLHDQLETGGEELVFQSTAMKTFYSQMQQVAATDANILLTGDNGTGKSLVARHMHAVSPRNGAPFISVNMGSITESLFESEMFGHVKGAFTDARENRIGRFELADGGTLFLDEIGNTPYSQQGKLLRVLEAREFEKVGASRTQQCDCRMICATNRDLERAVADNDFRQDLLFRVNTITLHVPALSQRRDDILPLADHFLARLAKKYARTGVALDPAARQTLLDYDWPGNVRELSHVIERAVILTAGDTIGPDNLGLRHRPASNAAPPGSASLTLAEIEKAVISARIRGHGGNWEDVARSLGLSKSAFYRRLEKHGLS